jgi:ankyrin repeat protein
MLRAKKKTNEVLDWDAILEDETTTDLMREIHLLTGLDELKPTVDKIATASVDDLCTVNSSGLTALHFATFRANPILVWQLILKGVKVDALDNFNWTPLHYTTYISAETKAATLVAKDLLEAGANPNQLSIADESPFHNAIPRGNTELVKMLIEFGGDLKSTCVGQRPLQLAVKHNNTEIISHILTLDKDINFRDNDGHTAMHIAVINRNVEAVKLLIKAGADLNLKENHYNTPLHTACSVGDIELVKTLIEHKAKLNEENDHWMSALSLAIEQNHTEIAEFLIKSQVQLNTVNHYHHTPLHLAILDKNEKIAKLLIKKNKSLLNMGDEAKRSPLAYACYRSDPSIVKMLVEQGAHLKARDDEGGHALHVAAKVGNLEILAFLLPKYSREALNGKNSLGETPLFIAAHVGKCEVVEKLIARGANIDEQNKKHETPLMRAIENRHLNIVRLLIQSGARVTEQNVNDVKKLNIPEILQVIEEAFARSHPVVKKKEKKIKTIKVELPAAPTMTAEDMAKKKEQEAQWLAQEQIRIQQEEALRQQEAIKRQEQKAKNELQVKTLSTEIYDFFAGLPESQKIFTRREKSKAIESMIRTHEHADRKTLAKALLVNMGIEKNSKLYGSLLDKFQGVLVPEPETVPEIPAPLPERNIQAEQEAENARRMQLNKALYRLEKEQEAAAVQRRKENQASSSSSSSAVPKIGMSTKEEAIRVRGLVNELATLALKYASPEEAKKRTLRELKHDLIKMSALIATVSESGAGALFGPIFKDPNEIKILRNGALHLLDVNSQFHPYSQEELNAFSHEFYLTIMLTLSVVAKLKNGLETGLNTVLNNLTESGVSPVSFQDSFETMHYSLLAQETYVNFEAHFRAWQIDPESQKRSDVHHEIELRTQALKTQSASFSHEEKVMLAVEIAELYKQGSNAGIAFPHYPDELIRLKNEFAHRGTEIREEQIDALFQLKKLSQLKTHRPN